jgi:hypothetical protein
VVVVACLAVARDDGIGLLLPHGCILPEPAGWLMPLWCSLAETPARTRQPHP